MKGIKRIYFIDIETYKMYDGTKECEEYIITNTGSFEALDYFKKNKKVGWYYPVLRNNVDFSLGGISQIGRKAKWFFKDRLEMKQKVIDITKQGIKEGHNSVFYIHNGNFDVPRLFLEEYCEFKLIHEFGSSKIWTITPKMDNI